MRDYYHLTIESKNKKTGQLAVVTSSNNTCPDACPFKSEGCYADFGPLKLHWDKVSNRKRGVDFEELLGRLSNIKSRIRLWQAGDMPGNNNHIDINKIRKLVLACKDAEAFGYTHKIPSIGDNAEAIKYCNNNGVTINLSANNLAHADDLYDLGIGPVTVVLSRGSRKRDIYTPKGRQVVVCPAEIGRITCNTCGGKKGALCYRNNRDYIIGFISHGNAMNRASKIAQRFDMFKV